MNTESCKTPASNMSPPKHFNPPKSNNSLKENTNDIPVSLHTELNDISVSLHTELVSLEDQMMNEQPISVSKSQASQGSQFENDSMNQKENYDSINANGDMDFNVLSQMKLPPEEENKANHEVSTKEHIPRERDLFE
eukprot:UN27264